MTRSSTAVPLRGAREARGLALREVARRVGTDPAHLSRIERGLKSPSLPMLKRIADVLSLPELSRFLAPYVGPERQKTPLP